MAEAEAAASGGRRREPRTTRMSPRVEEKVRSRRPSVQIKQDQRTSPLSSMRIKWQCRLCDVLGGSARREGKKAGGTEAHLSMYVYVGRLHKRGEISEDKTSEVAAHGPKALRASLTELKSLHAASPACSEAHHQRQRRAKRASSSPLLAALRI